MFKAASVVDAIFHSSEYKDTGSIGERFTYRILDDYFHKSRILRNIYIKKENEMTTEIDMIVVSPQGLLVIESKNLSGTIYGEENNKNWTQFLPPKSKNTLYNPISQNASHIKTLKRTLSEFPALLYFSVIVFSERCTLKVGEVTTPNTYVIQRFDIEKVVDNIRTQNKEVLTDEQQAQILESLKKSSRPSKAIQEKHINDVQTKCQFCASELIEKTNKTNGNKFLGCSAYPKCKFTKHI